MHTTPLETGRLYVIKHCARQVRAKAIAVRHRVNVNNLQSEATERLQMNDIATVELETSSPLFFDAYRHNRTTGSFILIDPLTNATLAAGMILEDIPRGIESPAKHGLPPQDGVTPLERHRRHGHQPAIILANTRVSLIAPLERAIFERGFEVMVVENNAAISSALHAAGFVVIYHNASLNDKELAELRNAAGAHFFDLGELGLPERQAEALERVMLLLEALRIPQLAAHPERIN
jgi:bifunctional enzyme CysN/CysC/sulfate adenylyltransferase subunit 1